MSSKYFKPRDKSETPSDPNQIALFIKIHGTPAEIWRALTDRDDLEEWWSEDVVLEPKVGGKFKEAWEDDQGEAQLATGKVLAVKPKQEIRFTWREKNWPGTLSTECTLTIEDTGQERLLKVLHVGWEAFPEGKRAKLMENFKVGWSYHLKELKAFVDDDIQ